MSSLVKAEFSGVTAHVTLNQPDKGNALSRDLVRSLDDAYDTALLRGSRMIVFRGEGKNFCTGFDLSDLASQSDGDLLLRFVEIEIFLQKVFSSSIITVAIGTGRVVGAGADLFIACNHRIAIGSSSYSFPGAGFGLVLGTRRLGVRVGNETAQSIILSGRSVSDDQAAKNGLATLKLDNNELQKHLGSMEKVATNMDLGTVASINKVLGSSDGSSDLASLVWSASRHSLKDRIIAYREAVRSAKK